MLTCHSGGCPELTHQKSDFVKGKVSVVIPVRFVNRRWLEKSISSVVEQDYPNKEVIIVNDEATESIDDLVASYGIKKYIKNPKNMGPAYSNNRGFEAADGEYYYKHDSDDNLYPGMLTRFVKELETHKEYSIVWGTHAFIDENDKYWGNSTNDIIRIAKAAGCANTSGPVERKFTFFGVCANCWLHRKEVMDEIKYDETLRFNTDFSFWLRASRNFKIWRLPLEEKPYSAYRSHPNNIGNTMNRTSQPKVAILKQEAQLYPDDKDLKRAITYWSNFDRNLETARRKRELQRRMFLLKYGITHPRSVFRNRIMKPAIHQ